MSDRGAKEIALVEFPNRPWEELSEAENQKCRDMREEMELILHGTPAPTHLSNRKTRH